MYSSTATIIIPTHASVSAASALESLSGGGLNLLGGGYNVYLDILKSRTIEDTLIKRFNLLSHYRTDQMWAAEKTLSAASTMDVSTEGLLTITVLDRDRNLAANLANAYAEELEKLNGRLAVTAAGQQRLFYQGQMIQEKDALAEAEAQLAAVQQRTSLIAPEVQAGQDIGSVAQAESNRRQLVTQLQALEQGATDQNPDVIRLKSQIAAVSGQIAQMQAGAGSGSSLSSLPNQTMQVARATRDVKFHEGLLASLSREYESAKEQEGRDNAVLEVLDPAEPGAIKAWPPRVKYWTYALVLGLVLGFAYTLVEAFVRAVLRNETNRARLRAFVLAPRG